MTSLTAFTSQLLNLSSNLALLYPEDPDLEFTKNSISLLKSTNPRKLQIMFDKYVGIYETQIMNKESVFFIEKDIVVDDIKTNETNIDYAKNIMYNLKKYWNDMDDISKDNIWKYLQVLIILNKKC